MAAFPLSQIADTGIADTWRSLYEAHPFSPSNFSGKIAAEIARLFFLMFTIDDCARHVSEHEAIAKVIVFFITVVIFGKSKPY